MDTKVQDFIQIHQLPEERFLPVNKFESRFWISDHGRIISYGGRVQISILSPHLDCLGYYAATLRMTPLKRKCRVHQLVGEHYCPMVYVPEKRMTWNHKDGDKLNNYYLNLEFITIGENVRHAVETGLFDAKGENHFNSKLTENQVREIRLLRTTGLTHEEIGKRFGICRRQAGDIINRVNWGWLE